MMDREKASRIGMEELTRGYRYKIEIFNAYVYKADPGALRALAGVLAEKAQVRISDIGDIALHEDGPVAVAGPVDIFAELEGDTEERNGYMQLRSRDHETLDISVCTDMPVNYRNVLAYMSSISLHELEYIAIGYI